jgi:triphosphoribosyl-dephospho-CoA synthase
MAEAAERDRIAYQFSTGFEDIFDRGMAAYDAALQRWPDRKWATLSVYLEFLASFSDTHIVRKYGAAAAEEVRRTAMDFRLCLQSPGDPADLLPDLLAWDTELKVGGLNPGTSADLTVATLFAHRLAGIHQTNILPPTRNSG